MTSTEEKITLEQMPQLLVELKGEILGIKEMIAALGGGENSTADQRMDLDAFRAYHPDKPARPSTNGSARKPSPSTKTARNSAFSVPK